MIKRKTDENPVRKRSLNIENGFIKPDTKRDTRLIADALVYADAGYSLTWHMRVECVPGNLKGGTKPGAGVPH